MLGFCVSLGNAQGLEILHHKIVWLQYFEGILNIILYVGSMQTLHRLTREVAPSAV